MIAVLLTLVSAYAASPCADTEAAIASRSAEIKAIYDAGEAERADRSSTTTSVLKRDDERLKTMLKFDKKGELCTPEDKWFAAWIILNTDKFDELERAYELAQETMKERHANGAWLVGYSFDRWRMARGYMQAYGSQTRPVGSVRCLPTVDPAITDAERAAYGQPPLVDVYRRVLDMNGFPDDAATFDRVQRRGLACDPIPWKGNKRVAAPPEATYE